MEPGSSQHGGHPDDAPTGRAGRGGTGGEGWADAEPAAGDRASAVDDAGPVLDEEAGHQVMTPAATVLEDGSGGYGPGAPDQDEAEMRRLQHDMAVANDWNPGEDADQR